MLLLWSAIKGFRHNVNLCYKVSERKHLSMAAEEAQVCTKKDFQAYRRLLTNTVLFKYLYRILTDKANGWPVVVDKLWKDRKKWYQMYSIIRREGANARTASSLFKAFVQAVLLFRSETSK